MNRNIQWMIVVPQDADQGLIDFLTEKIGQIVGVARQEYPTEEVKYAVLTFDEAEL